MTRLILELLVLLLGAAVGVWLLIQLLRRNSALAAAAKAAAARPVIEDAINIYLAGNPDITHLRVLAGSYPEECGDIVSAFAASVGGGARDRLADLALSLALVHLWLDNTRAKDPDARRKAFSRLESISYYEPVHRTAEGVLLRGAEDPDEEARILAVRALAHNGDLEHVARAFAIALSAGVSNRLVIALDLRPYATALCPSEVTLALKSSSLRTVLAALEILESWECALDLDMTPLTKHSDIAVRTKAMSLLPRTPLNWENRDALLAGLADSDTQVSMTAARAAGRMRARVAIPALELCLRRGDRELEDTAAEALALIRSGDLDAEFVQAVSQGARH